MKATVYLEQDGEKLFTHRVDCAPDDERGAASLAVTTWRFSGMKGYTHGAGDLTARVEWDEDGVDRG